MAMIATLVAMAIITCIAMFVAYRRGRLNKHHISRLRKSNVETLLPQVTGALDNARTRIDNNTSELVQMRGRLQSARLIEESPMMTHRDRARSCGSPDY